jgi:hypothetical protein
MLCRKLKSTLRSGGESEKKEIREGERKKLYNSSVMPSSVDYELGSVGVEAIYDLDGPQHQLSMRFSYHLKDNEFKRRIFIEFSRMRS